MKIYMAQTGDTFSKIAKAHHITWDTLMEANPQIKHDEIREGIKITIPGAKIPIRTTQAKSIGKNSGSASFGKASRNDTRKIPFIEEDDVIKGIMSPALPFTKIQEKKKYPLETEWEYPVDSTNFEKDSSTKVRQTSNQYNPVSIFRNPPRENIPEVHLIHGTPSRVVFRQ